MVSLKIVVCVKEINCEINPFDECALECALCFDDAEIHIVSMGRERAIDPIKRLSRLGNIKPHLLCDSAFAGSDTLATGYVLSEMIKKTAPDLVICGRQSIDGDTGQVGPAISEYLGYSLITNVLEIYKSEGGKIYTRTRVCDESAPYPAVICVDRINTLRFPKIGQKPKEVEVLSASDLGIDTAKCGLKGSPTQVVKSFQNEIGKRRCKFIEKEDLAKIISDERAKEKKKTEIKSSDKKLNTVWAVGKDVLLQANSIAENVVSFDIPEETDKEAGIGFADMLEQRLKSEKCDAILFPANFWGRKYAPLLQVRLKTGLCADCTFLETDGNELFMYRPALGGDITAKIRCNTKPAMATVRIDSKTENDVIISVGKGAADKIDLFKSYAEKCGFGFGVSRPVVDTGKAPYDSQVGLTGKNVNPKIYIAIGISGAVQHTCAIEKAGVVIGINPDKNARIFSFCDYGIVCTADEILKVLC